MIDDKNLRVAQWELKSRGYTWLHPLKLRAVIFARDLRVNAQPLPEYTKRLIKLGMVKPAECDPL